MRLNFTGRRKIDRQHARLTLVQDTKGCYFDINLQLQHYPQLSPSARVFIEAYRKLVLMRFDFGFVGQLADLSPSSRRLSEFSNPDDIKFRVKVTQSDGTEAGKLLAEADGLTPYGDDFRTSLIQLVGADDLGQTPWELAWEPTDPDLPTLRINNTIGGKQRAHDPIFRTLVLPSVVHEVFTQLLHSDIEDDEPEHWTHLWATFATNVLSLSDPRDLVAVPDSPEAICWTKQATDTFSQRRHLVDRFLSAQPEGGIPL